jgi:hypothetical protein
MSAQCLPVILVLIVTHDLVVKYFLYSILFMQIFNAGRYLGGLGWQIVFSIISLAEFDFEMVVWVQCFP